MKASLFCTTRYEGPSRKGIWPVPADSYSAEIAQKSYQRWLSQIQLGDDVGFDYVTVAEHHFAPFSMSPNPLILAGVLTQRLRNAKIALLGPDLPILNPVRVAEEIAMLDTLSGGRVIAGLMRGSPNEYVTYNINPAESRERFQEGIQVIRMAWTEPQAFGWQGRYYDYRSISIWPRPVQKPHPPIFISAATPESGEFAARHRFGVGFAFTTLQIATKAAEYYRQQARVFGWEPSPDEVIYRLSFHVAKTDEQAVDDLVSAGMQASLGLGMTNKALEAAVAGSGYYGRDIETQRARLQSRGEINDRIENGQLLAGSPETVLKQIRRVRDTIGAGMLDLSLGAATLGEKTLQSIEMFGTKVLPQMRAL
ncbi:MAG TPA: LLM class flavin-dependent oxidoreductase [Stellaceae bacterium]|nr:LLM class flavin-dependent oxidoreductase [Stellaceae bacterium]